MQTTAMRPKHNAPAESGVVYAVETVDGIVLRVFVTKTAAEMFKSSDPARWNNKVVKYVRQIEEHCPGCGLSL